MKKAAIGILTFLGLCAGAWGVTEIFVLKPVYEVEIAGIAEQIIEMQKNNAVQRQEDKVFYWHRLEVQKLEECARASDTVRCQRELDEIRRNKRQCEENLERMRAP